MLIDGKRVSGRSNDAVTELSRVSAANVVRIDIVDGATLDVPGLSGDVANVITRPGGIKGPAQYTIGIENNSFRGAAGGPTRISSMAAERSSICATMSSPPTARSPSSAAAS